MLGTVPLGSGSATLPVTFAAGIHRLSAIYRGSGLFDGSAAAEIIQVINQATAGRSEIMYYPNNPGGITIVPFATADFSNIWNETP